MAVAFENLNSSRDMFDSSDEEDNANSDPNFSISNLRAQFEENSSDSDEGNDSKNNLQKKRDKNDKSHTMCKYKCGKELSQLEQNAIKDEFKKLNHRDQMSWLAKFCKRRSHVHRKLNSPKKKRQPNIDYFLPKLGGNMKVCKTFFLCTLGFHETSHKRIQKALEVSSPGGSTPPSKKGKYIRSTLLKDQITEHILSYHPQISHYRREHAPHRLYLSNELTVKIMHEDFCKKTKYKRESLILNLSKNNEEIKHFIRKTR